MPIAVATLALLGWGAPAIAAQPEELLDEVLVTGEQPGPAMWKVSSGDHTLWIIGTLSPLPAQMTWRSRQADAVVQRADGILAASATRGNLPGGTFAALRYLPAALRLRHNADGATLREVLPPDIYSRWQAAHQRWFGKAPDPRERARPLYAADLLFQQALRRSGLARGNPVWERVEQLAKQHRIQIRRREFVVQLEDPKQLIAELAALPPAKEAACLLATLDRIDHDLPQMQRRAQAWAVGDLDTLLALPQRVDTGSCREAVLDKPHLRTLIEEQDRRQRADWTGIVDWMLLTQATSITTLPIDELLDENSGVVPALRAKGYLVEAPR